METKMIKNQRLVFNILLKTQYYKSANINILIIILKPSAFKAGL